MKIIISRTDNIGDVILTLPMVGYIKENIPNAKIYFIGKSYTKPIIESCIYIDFFLNKADIIENPAILEEIKADTIIFVFPDKELASVAKKVKIPNRIGTSHRWFHWFYINKKVDFSRKNSTLHEAQLNFKLLAPLFSNYDLSTEKISSYFGLNPNQGYINNIHHLLNKDKKNIIFHPKSKGSAREWTLDNFYKLAQLLPENQYQIYITGVAEEGKLISQEKPQIFDLPNVENLTGKLSMYELIAFISQVDCLIAASTGPLHIAAALGRFCIGIYPPMRPIHPERWKPLGNKAICLSEQKQCSDCRKMYKCACMAAITPENVLNVILNNV